MILYVRNSVTMLTQRACLIPTASLVVTCLMLPGIGCRQLDQDTYSIAGTGASLQATEWYCSKPTLL
jgi:hypothetical protein